MNSLMLTPVCSAECETFAMRNCEGRFARPASSANFSAAIFQFAQGFAGTSDLASLDCQHIRTTVGLKASNFRCTLSLHRVASAFSPPQLFAYHILQRQLVGGRCTRLLCCIVQIFRFSFCRSQDTDFAAHQSSIHNSSTGIAYRKIELLS